MNTPLVSIVLPTYNRARLLPRAIASVKAQSMRDWELVIVDDASTDDTPMVLAPLTRDPVIRSLRLSNNRGQAMARNTGIQAARGRFLAFIDSDDEWLPDKLAVQLDAWEQAPDKPGLVHCDMMRVAPSGEERLFPTPDVESGRLIHPRSRDYQVKYLGIQSVLIGPSVPRAEVRFDTRLRALEDLELLARLSLITDFQAIHRPLVRYHAGPGVSMQFNHVAEARRRLLRRHYAHFTGFPEALAYQYGKIARAYLRGGRPAFAKVFARRAIATAPGSLSISLPALAPLLGLRRMTNATARITAGLCDHG